MGWQNTPYSTVPFPSSYSVSDAWSPPLPPPVPSENHVPPQVLTLPLPPKTTDNDRFLKNSQIFLWKPLTVLKKDNNRTKNNKNKVKNPRTQLTLNGNSLNHPLQLLHLTLSKRVFLRYSCRSVLSDVERHAFTSHCLTMNFHLRPRSLAYQQAFGA